MIFILHGIEPIQQIRAKAADDEFVLILLLPVAHFKFGQLVLIHDLPHIVIVGRFVGRLPIGRAFGVLPRQHEVSGDDKPNDRVFYAANHVLLLRVT